MVAEGNISPVRGGKSSPQPADRLIGELAGRQHGVVAIRQLRATGLTRRMVEIRVERGALHRVHAGVYAVGHPALSPDGRLMAAALAPGPGAILSHRSAAWLWGLLRSCPAVLEATHPCRRQRRPGLRVHRASVPDDERAARRGIPVTGPFRTLLDLAVVADRHQLERALHEAEVARLTDRLTLHALIARYPGRRGVAALRAAVRELDGGVRRTRSALEDRFLRFLAERGLPLPETNVRIETARRAYEVDCLWRARRLIVELDGRGAHDTGRGFLRDRAKLRALTAAGWRALPVTWPDIVGDPDALEREIAGLLGSAEG